MNINLDLYRKDAVPLIKNFVARNDADTGAHLPLVQTMGLMAISTGCHIIAIGYYLCEIYGLTDELQDKIEKLQRFYKITSVTDHNITTLLDNNSVDI